MVGYLVSFHRRFLFFFSVLSFDVFVLLFFFVRVGFFRFWCWRGEIAEGFKFSGFGGGISYNNIEFLAGLGFVRSRDINELNIGIS